MIFQSGFMFKQDDRKIIEEIKIGDPPGTWLRLEENEKGRQYITSWSNMTKQFNVMYRYDIETNWTKWKKMHASLYSERYKK